MRLGLAASQVAARRPTPLRPVEPEPLLQLATVGQPELRVPDGAALASPQIDMSSANAHRLVCPPGPGHPSDPKPTSPAPRPGRDSSGGGAPVTPQGGSGRRPLTDRAWPPLACLAGRG